MNRRLLIAGIACWPAARLLAQAPEPRPRHKVSAAELYEALSARFPLRLGLAGLLELQVSAPQLLLLPARNKLGATLVAQASGPAVQPMPPGALDVVFGLRYEPADQTVRAQQMEVLDIRMPGLSADTTQALRTVLPQLFRDAVGELVLHKFSQRELALPETMGFEPETLTVLADGVLVGFAPKPRR
jgi:hypothetical protein